ILYGSAPSLSHLRVFGCLCYAHKIVMVTSLLPGVVVVYLLVILLAKRGRVCMIWIIRFPFSRDVEFLEAEFPYHSDSSEPDFFHHLLLCLFLLSRMMIRIFWLSLYLMFLLILGLLLLIWTRLTIGGF
ncbi:Unknown protein, partial [Striga hermonthica]